MQTQFISTPRSPLVSGRVRDFLGKTNRAIAAQLPGGSPEEVQKVMLKSVARPAGSLTVEDLVAKLISDNQVLWNKLLKNEFCTKMKDSPGTDQKVLAGFKWYMTQDFLYCFKGLMYEVIHAPRAASPEQFDTTMDSAAGYASYTKIMLDTCIKKLGVKYSDSLFTYETDALKNYVEFLLNTAAKASNWVVVVAALIPCIQSYYQIAVDLKAHSIDKESTWYKLWVEVNASQESYQYTEDQKNLFIKYADQWETHYAEANKLFQEGCNHEIALWNTALTPPANAL